MLVAGRLCFNWAKEQRKPCRRRQASRTSAAPTDCTAARCCGSITHIHTRLKNVFFVGHIEREAGWTFNRKMYVPQIDGAKTGLELPASSMRC